MEMDTEQMNTYICIILILAEIYVVHTRKLSKKKVTRILWTLWVCWWQNDGWSMDCDLDLWDYILMKSFASLNSCYFHSFSQFLNIWGASKFRRNCKIILTKLYEFDVTKSVGIVKIFEWNWLFLSLQCNKLK